MTECWPSPAPLSGHPLRVARAEKIREKILEQILDIPVTSLRADALRTILAQSQSSWWIDHRDKSLERLVGMVEEPPPRRLDAERSDEIRRAQWRLDRVMCRLIDWRDRFQVYNRDGHLAHWIASGKTFGDLIAGVEADMAEAEAAWDACVAHWTDPAVIEVTGRLRFEPEREHPVDGRHFRQTFREWWSVLRAEIERQAAATI